MGQRGASKVDQAMADGTAGRADAGTDCVADPAPLTPEAPGAGEYLGRDGVAIRVGDWIIDATAVEATPLRVTELERVKHSNGKTMTRARVEGTGVCPSNLEMFWLRVEPGPGTARPDARPAEVNDGDAESIDAIREATLACATAWEPQARLIGNVRADELEALCLDHAALRAQVAELERDLGDWCTRFHALKDERDALHSEVAELQASLDHANRIAANTLEAKLEAARGVLGESLVAMSVAASGGSLGQVSARALADRIAALLAKPSASEPGKEGGR